MQNHEICEENTLQGQMGSSKKEIDLRSLAKSRGKISNKNRCWKHTVGLAASVERKTELTELTFQV